jgi:hypothetical protein
MSRTEAEGTKGDGADADLGTPPTDASSAYAVDFSLVIYHAISFPPLPSTPSSASGLVEYSIWFFGGWVEERGTRDKRQGGGGTEGPGSAKLLAGAARDPVDNI